MNARQDDIQLPMQRLPERCFGVHVLHVGGEPVGEQRVREQRGIGIVRDLQDAQHIRGGVLLLEHRLDLWENTCYRACAQSRVRSL